MKTCPICDKSYYDDTLEFCLDDGSRLLKREKRLGNIIETSPTIESKKITQDETVQIKNQPDFFQPISHYTSSEIKTISKDKKEIIKQNVAASSQKFLEVAPTIFALIHNFWQWLYLHRQPAAQISTFLTSYNFLIWLLLLLTGLMFGIFSLKYSKNKGFAITALVVIAINVILSIVPK